MPQNNTRALPVRLTAATVSSAGVIGLILSFSWAWDWLWSGAAILSQLLIYDQTRDVPALPSTRPWMTLAALNLSYAITCTSWLQYRLFTAICWIAILFALVSVTPWVSNVGRAIFSRLLTRTHFTDDVIAGFDLPALHLDLGLEGIITIRGWTVALSGMTMKLHGVQAAYNLPDSMHISLYCDEIAIRLFREIAVGAIYGVLKQEAFVVEPGPDRANNAISRPANATATGDVKAQNHYHKVREDVNNTSPIHQCRARTDGQEPPQLDEKIRAATCEKLTDFTSVPSRPGQSIKASTVLEMVPLWIRRFFARMPFLLRLILLPLSYFHPIQNASASFSASGSWLANVMRDQLYSVYNEHRDDVKEIEQNMTNWMEDATFCVDLADVQLAAKVSARSSQDMMAYLRCGSSTLMRVEPASNKATSVISLKGMDATFSIPPFLLPSHEHLLPPRPSEQEARKDQAEVKSSYHINLPVVVDAAIVDFCTNLVNTTITMSMEEIVDECEGHGKDLTDKSKMARAKVKATAAVRNASRSMKKGMEKSVFCTRSDSWLPQIVSRIASHLEVLHGDVGYSGSLAVPLAPYRGIHPMPTKLLA